MATVLGVGPGVFVLGFFLVFFLLVCFLGSRTRQGGIIILGSSVAYGLIFIILFASPREEAEDAITSSITKTDYTVMQRGFMMFAMILAVILAIVGLLLFHVEPPVYAKPIDYRTNVLRY